MNKDKPGTGIQADTEDKSEKLMRWGTYGSVMAAFISGSSVLLIFEVADRLLNKQVIENEMVGITVMIISIVITALLVKFQRYVVSHTESLA